MSVQSCPSYDRAEFLEAQGSAAHEMSIEERNADTIYAWRKSIRYAWADAHIGFTTDHVQRNPKLSFITWAKKHGVEIEPITRRYTLTRGQIGSAKRVYLYNVRRAEKHWLPETPHLALGRADTFQGAMQVACTAIFGKL